MPALCINVFVAGIAEHCGTGAVRIAGGLNSEAQTVTISQKRIAGTLITAALLAALVTVLGWRISVASSAGSAGVSYFGEPTAEQRNLEESGIGLFQQPLRTVLGVIPGSSAARAGVQAGDKVQAINGVDVADVPGLEALDAKLKAGDVVTYTLEREGQRLQIPVVLESALQSPATLVGLISGLALGFAYLTISTFVFLMKPDSRLTFVFYLTCMVGAMVFFVGSFQNIEGMARGILPASGFNAGPLIAFFTYLFLAIVMSALLLHLSLIFPRERELSRRYPAVIPALYLLPFVPVLALAVVLGPVIALAWLEARWAITPVVVLILVVPAVALAWLFVRGRKENRTDNFVLRHAWEFVLVMTAFLAGILGMLMYVLPRETVVVVFTLYGGSMLFWLMGAGVAYAILTCAALIMSYRESGVEEKRQVRWPLWGTIVTLGVTAAVTIAYLVAMNISPLILGRSPNVTLAIAFVVKLLFLLIPISFAFGILKYRLMEIDVIIKKTLIYGIVTGIVVVLYLGLVGGLGTVIVQYTGVQNQTITVMSTLAIAALFIPVRNRVQSLVDRRFFRRRFDYPATLAILDERMPAMADLDAQVRFAAEQLQQAAQTRSVAVFVKEPGEPFAPVASIGLPDERVQRTRLNFSAAQLRGEQMVQLAAMSPHRDERAKLESLGAAVVVTVMSKGEPVGVMTVGPKLTREELDDEDTDFFIGVASRLADAIELQRDRKQASESRQAADIQQALLP
ncbi:MAG TPA: PDZ domain-containing protein, partial [Thermoanaerobaculia bacterium]|nr:PDZ domain-containing protein [Thermoanaerobaculia bacterium]